MNSPNEIPFDLLGESDLYIDCVYRGGSMGHRGDDPLSPLLGVGNAGGFRAVGRGHARFAAIFSTGSELDWPDRFIDDGRRFVYYGDQRAAGADVLDTARGGNRLLRRIFALENEATPEARAAVPPLFLFRKFGSGRDVQFGGMLVPVRRGLVLRTHDLGEGMVTNFEATFAVLRPLVVQRDWVHDLRSDAPMTRNGPADWFKWVAVGS